LTGDRPFCGDRPPKTLRDLRRTPPAPHDREIAGIPAAAPVRERFQERPAGRQPGVSSDIIGPGEEVPRWWNPIPKDA
jgi:hypothetical protein